MPSTVTLNGPHFHSDVAPAELNNEFRMPTNSTMGMNMPSERKNGRTPRKYTRYAPAIMQVSATYTGCCVQNVKQIAVRKNSMHTAGWYVANRPLAIGLGDYCALKSEVNFHTISSPSEIW